MSAAREEILARIGAALSGGAPVPRTEISREYITASPLDTREVVSLFCERASEYRAEVRIVSGADVREQVALCLGRAGGSAVVVPKDLPGYLVPADVRTVADEGLSNAEIAGVNVVLTGCALAIAQTGTLVLDGGRFQGRRKITLLPDHHICLVWRDQVVGTVPEAVARLASAVKEERRPVTFISGPSATSDIELNRVEGVHGPRNLYILIVDEDRPV